MGKASRRSRAPRPGASSPAGRAAHPSRSPETPIARQLDPTIRRSEWVLVSLWTVAILTAIGAPYWDAYRHAEPGWTFNGFIGA